MPELTADSESALARLPFRASTLAVVVLSLAVVGSILVGSVAVSADSSSTPPPDRYSVVQGDRCVDVAPVTGSQTVNNFYDYRNPYPEITGNPSSNTYSAHGMREYQESRVSTLLLYRGPNGDSLVSETGELDANAPGGSTVTFTFENLPSTGQWVVQDDEYPGRDDTWEVDSTSTTVTWRWAGNRTDGGAYSGLERATEPIVVDAQFNEDAPAWGQWSYSGSPEHRIQNWRVVSADGQRYDLDMSEPIYVSAGSCASAPAPTLEASETDVPRGQTVEFEADGDRADRDSSITEFRWDFDGDGDVDETTESETVTHRYESAGTYDASVSVFGPRGESEPSTLTVRVGQSDESEIRVTGVEDGTAVAGEPSPVTVSLVNDGGGPGTVDLQVVADDEVVGSQSVEVDGLSERTATVNATFPEEGEYDVSVRDAEAEIEVAEANPELSVTDVSLDDERVSVNEDVTVTATVENVGNAGDEFDVRLELFDEVVSSKSVSVPAGESRSVEFTVSASAPGTYTAQVGEESAELVVAADETPEEPSDSGPTDSGSVESQVSGFSAVAAFLAVAALLVVAVRRVGQP